MTIIYLVLAVSSHWMMDIFKKLASNLKIKLYIYKHVFKVDMTSKESKSDKSFNELNRNWSFKSINKSCFDYFEGLLKTIRHEVFTSEVSKKSHATDMVLNLKDRQAKFHDHIKESQDKVKKMFEEFNKMDPQSLRKQVMAMKWKEENSLRIEEKQPSLGKIPLMQFRLQDINEYERLDSELELLMSDCTSTVLY